MEATLYFKHFVKLTPLQMKLLPFVAAVPRENGSNGWAASTPTKARGVLFVWEFPIANARTLTSGWDYITAGPADSLSDVCGTTRWWRRSGGPLGARRDDGGTKCFKVPLIAGMSRVSQPAPVWLHAERVNLQNTALFFPFCVDLLVVKNVRQTPVPFHHTIYYAASLIFLLLASWAVFAWRRGFLGGGVGKRLPPPHHPNCLQATL